MRHPFNGIVPHFPDLDQFDRDAMAAELADVLALTELVDGRGTYWNGKSLGRAGRSSRSPSSSATRRRPASSRR